MIYKFLIIFLLMNFSSTAMADCFFVRLTGYQLSARYDFFYWGEFSPLIALEAGYFYNLSPKDRVTTGQSGGTIKKLLGETYYIPQPLINNNQFSLRLMVLDRDEDDRDDLVLPLTERLISLQPNLFVNNAYKSSVFIRRFGTNVSVNRDQMYEFQFLKNDNNCNLNSAEGRTNDAHYRAENTLKRLHLHILFYDQPYLNDGYEYLSYNSSEIQRGSYSTALSSANIIAAINSSELIDMGNKLKKLNKADGFSKVWAEYKQLIKRLYKQQFEVKYKEKNSSKIIKVPTLSFHPKWKDLTGQSGFGLPKKWHIDLSTYNDSHINQK